LEKRAGVVRNREGKRDVVKKGECDEKKKRRV